MNNNILLLIKLPPPITGATLMNSYVHQSSLLRESFNICEIKLSYAKDVNDFGNFRLGKFKILFGAIIKLISIIILKKPALVYFQISPLGIAFLRDLVYVFILKLFKIKIVFHLHGKGIEKTGKNIFLKILYRWAFKNSEIICLSNKLAEDVKNVFSGKPFIVPNGIKNIKIEKSNSNNDEVIILFLSNLHVSKGILEYLDALEILKSRTTRFKGIIVGKEGRFLKNELDIIIKEKKLNNWVEYLGAKYGKEKEEILSKADILIYPTKNDAFPIVLLEAMQFSVPIITTAQGAIPEIIDDGVNGFIISENNPKQIMEKIELLIENKELRKNIGLEGNKKYLENFTLVKFENNLYNVLSTIMS